MHIYSHFVKSYANLTYISGSAYRVPDHSQEGGESAQQVSSDTGGRSKTSTRRPTNDDEEIRSDLTPGSTAGAANLGMGPSTHVKQ